MSPATTPVALAVLTDAEATRERATRLAEELRVPLVAGVDQGSHSFEFLLAVTEKQIELREPGQNVAPLFVDFVDGATALRRKSGQSRKQPIARAIGIKGDGCNVLDATAGLGRDAFLLACLGCRVTGVERSAVLFALLEDGMRRARETLGGGLLTIMSRLQFMHADARSYLQAIDEAARPDVVYLDPMFPSRKKSALEGREIRVCRALVGADEDADELLQVARVAARKRVVVKRHRQTPPLDKPDFEIAGRTVRYDVYMCRMEAPSPKAGE